MDHIVCMQILYPLQHLSCSVRNIFFLMQINVSMYCCIYYLYLTWNACALEASVNVPPSINSVTSQRSSLNIYACTNLTTFGWSSRLRNCTSLLSWSG